jgi:hypothetical protein
MRDHCHALFLSSFQIKLEMQKIILSQHNAIAISRPHTALLTDKSHARKVHAVVHFRRETATMGSMADLPDAPAGRLSSRPSYRPSARP